MVPSESGLRSHWNSPCIKRMHTMAFLRISGCFLFLVCSVSTCFQGRIPSWFDRLALGIGDDYETIHESGLETAFRSELASLFPFFDLWITYR